MVPCTPVQKFIIRELNKFCLTCYLKTLLRFVPLIQVHAIEWSRVRSCCVLERKIGGLKCGNDVDCLGFFFS